MSFDKKELETAKKKMDNTSSTRFLIKDDWVQIEKIIDEDNDVKELFNSLYNQKDKLFYFSKTQKKFERIPSKSSILSLIEMDFPNLIIHSKKGIKKYFKYGNKFLDIAFYINSIDLVYKENDLFQKEEITVKKVDKSLYITTNYITKNDVKYIEDYSEESINEVIKDYKEHFKELDEILEWIVACRFSEDRRSSFLYLNLPAGFGKSFFNSILCNELKLFVNCRYEDFKSPSSLSPNEFDNTLYSLSIDEFTVFKKDFKGLIHNLICDAKFEMRTQVKLYAKLLLSAEKSISLSSEVDSQIQDRVNVINKTDSNKLEEREIYCKYGNMMYYNIISVYILNFILNKIDEFVKMGKIESSRVATKILQDFKIKYPLKADNIEDKIKELFLHKIHHCFYSDYHTLDAFDKIIKDSIYKDHKNNDIIYIKNAKSLLEQIIKIDDEFYKKARYKMNNIENILGVEYKKKRISGHNIYCVEIKIKDLEEVDKLFN